VSVTVALFAAGALTVVLSRPSGRRALRELLYPSAPASLPRAHGPLSPQARPQSPPDEPQPAPAPALPARWSARAPTDRRVFAIEDPCVAPTTDAGGPCVRAALDPFYTALSQLERGARRRVRVAHLGDSIVADDKITGRLRARLQAEFGDAGLGFLYAQRPTRWYHPRGVRFDGRGFALTSVVEGRSTPAEYGPGAAAFDARSAGATASVTLRASGEAIVSGLEREGGVGLSARVDAGPWTALDEPGGRRRLALGADALHAIEVRADRAGARVFGVSVERAARGVIVDNLGLVSSSARALAQQDRERWERALAALAPDLVVISLGTNDSSHGPIPLAHRPALEEDHHALFASARRAAGACLVLLTPDTAEERGGPLGTRGSLAAIHTAQRRAAERAGCAVWDTFRWMGGRDSILRWRRWGLADGDYTHLSDAGGARVADALADALLAGRDAFESRTGTAGGTAVSRDL
jgi:lysophospholipase L1-like esterase